MRETRVSLPELKKKAPRGFWTLVIRALNEKGVTRSQGEKWSDRRHVSTYWNRHQGKVLGLIARELKEAPQKTSKKSSARKPIPRKDLKSSERKQPFVTREELRAELEKLRQELSTATTRVQPVQKGSEESLELAPSLPKTKKVRGPARQRLGVTIDWNLMRLLDKERRRRRISMSRMIDTICWHYFGKPQLSFQNTSGEKS